MPDSVPVYRKTFSLKEKQTGTYSFTIKDEAGVVIPASSLTGLTLSLYSANSGAIVNGRDSQHVKNANNVTVSEAGVVTWTQLIADVSILDDGLAEETHRGLFLFTWSTGGVPRSHPHEVDFLIQNMGKVS